jgi:type IV pilus assembly protein PilM
VALSLPGFFRRGPQPLIGIDISSSSVKLVELSAGAKTGLRLERYAIEPIERGAVVDGNIENPEQVADALTRAVKRSGTRAKSAALALPSSAVISKRIMLAAGLIEEDYDLQVESEASQYIPFAIDEVNLDYQILGLAAQSTEDVEVLLAASRKEKVEDRVAVAEMAGLTPTVIDVEPYAARIAIDHVSSFLPNHGDSMILAVFDIGQSNTSLTVVFNGQTIFERDQNFGGLLLTQEIMRLYGLTFEESEQKKRSGELPDNYASELLAPFVEQATTEAARALQFFFTSTPYSRVDRIFLAGGCAVTPGLAESIADRSRVPTEIMSPFQGMEVGSGIRERQFRLDAPALMVGCGLAMRRFDK